MRVEPHQGNFATKLGVPRNRQSFLENGERELRADYLDLISQHGLDIQYILTGQRGGELLPLTESRLLDLFRSLGAEAQAAVLVVVGCMVGDTAQPKPIAAASVALHDKQSNLTGEGE